MNVKHIDFVIDVLSNLPEDRDFNLNHWGQHGGEHPPAENNFCGTSACAIGWVVLDPRAKKLGLEAYWDGEMLLPRFLDTDEEYTYNIIAVAMWLEISVATAMKLFYPVYYSPFELIGSAARAAVISRLMIVKAGYVI